MNRAYARFALGAALTLTIAATPLASYASAPRPQEHHDADRDEHPEWHNNRYYRMGNREGYQDYGRHEQRRDHNHHYRNDDDRRAHDYGYQRGWSGTQYDAH